VADVGSLYPAFCGFRTLAVKFDPGEIFRHEPECLEFRKPLPVPASGLEKADLFHAVRICGRQYPAYFALSPLDHEERRRMQW
jgi:hypothetical protein